MNKLSNQPKYMYQPRNTASPLSNKNPAYTHVSNSDYIVATSTVNPTHSLYAL